MNACRSWSFYMEVREAPLESLRIRLADSARSLPATRGRVAVVERLARCRCRRVRAAGGIGANALRVKRTAHHRAAMVGGYGVQRKVAGAANRVCTGSRKLREWD